MAQPKKSSKRDRKDKAADLFLRADQNWERRRFRTAFRLFLEAVNAGDRSAQLNVGYFYDLGIGTKADRSAALNWYRKAYRKGDSCAAANIATIWRDQRKPLRALAW